MKYFYILFYFSGKKKYLRDILLPLFNEIGGIQICLYCLKSIVIEILKRANKIGFVIDKEKIENMFTRF